MFKYQGNSIVLASTHPCHPENTKLLHLRPPHPSLLQTNLVPLLPINELLHLILPTATIPTLHTSTSTISLTSPATISLTNPATITLWELLDDGGLEGADEEVGSVGGVGGVDSVVACRYNVNGWLNDCVDGNVVDVCRC